jgi:hypothetical protein
MYAMRHVRGEEVNIELIDETQLHIKSCFPRAEQKRDSRKATIYGQA